jgi:hypothetical protein
VREDAPELGRTAFHLDQCATEYGFLLSLGQRLLEQATKAVLLPLDPQEILNLLPRTRAWDLRAQKRTTYDFSVRESRRLGKGAETGNVLIPYAHPDEMSKPPHQQMVSLTRRLSSSDLALRVRISRRR